MAAGGGISGTAVALVAGGGVLVFSGVENTPVTQVFRSLARGRKPAPGPEAVSQLNSGTGSAGVPVTDSAIANDALTYVGHPYHYGGYQADPAGWDCSSFVNWVLGHDLGLTLPGGVAGYDGTSHGPVVAQYQIWSGAAHISRAEVQPGDLILYTTVHMGIATGGGQFVSAEQPSTGTGVAPVSSGPGPWNAVRVRT